MLMFIPLVCNNNQPAKEFEIKFSNITTDFLQFARVLNAIRFKINYKLKHEKN